MKIPNNWKAPTGYLNNRTVLITGAGSGIGRAVSKECARLGATVVLIDRTVRALEQVYDEIEAAGSAQAAIYPMNFEGAAEKDYSDLAVTLENEFGQLDGILHNAAMLGALTPMAHFETDLWFKIMQINLNAPFLLTRSCLPLLIKSNDASIVFNSDQVGRKGKAYWGAYAISKSGCENMAEILADELEANTQIRVNSIHPGAVATPLRSLAYPGEDPTELYKPEDVVNPYLYLLGADGRGITGKQFEM